MIRTLRLLMRTDRVTLALLLFATLAMRAFVAPGMMVEAADGDVRIAICSQSPLSPDHVTRDALDGEEPGSNEHCGYTVLAGGGVLPDQPVAVAPLVAEPIAVEALVATPGVGAAAPLPPSTGPPSLS